MEEWLLHVWFQVVVLVMLQTSPKMFICIGFLWILTKVWENKVPRKNWTSSANSAICERHFLPSDYVTKYKQSRRREQT